MNAKILDGKVLSKELQSQLKAEVDRLRHLSGKTPCFVNIGIGHDPSAGSYSKSQRNAAEFIGIDYRFTNLPVHVTQAELLDHVRLLNEDANVHGVMLHKPVPPQIDFQQAINVIVPEKDIEGMNISNLGALMLGRKGIIPCTPSAAMALLLTSGIDLSGKNAVVVGRSEIFGKPMMMLLLEKNATVSVGHSHTSKAGRLADLVKNADIVVVAIGKANFVKGDWIKEGAVVIDVGINSVDGKIVGDVDFSSAAEKASYITPVPGGVGPVTSVMLMRNGIETYKNQLNLK